MSEAKAKKSSAGTAAKQANPIEEINVGLLLYVVRKNIFIVLLLVLVGISFSWIYLRYVPRIYESSATLMLQSVKTNEVLGVEKIMEIDQKELQREVELMRSKNFIENAIDSLGLEIAYFQAGRTNLLNSEIYPSPFVKIECNVLKPFLYGQRIYINVLDDYHYEFRYAAGERDIVKKMRFNETFKNTDIEFKVVKNFTSYKKLINPEIFIIIKDKSQLVSEIISNIDIQPLNLSTRTLSVSYKSENISKAYSIVAQLSQRFMEYNRQRKAESIYNILNFIDDQIDTIGQEYFRIQDSMNRFMVESGLIDPERQMDISFNTLRDIDVEEKRILVDKRVLEGLNNYLKRNDDVTFLMGSQLEGTASVYLVPLQHIKLLTDKKRELLLDLNPDHPDITILEQQIEETKKELITSIQSAVNKNDIRYKAIQAERAKTIAFLFKIPENQNKFSELEQERDRVQQIYLNLVDQKAQYSIALAGIVSDFILIQAASVPKSPISPNILMIRASGLIFGLIVGLFLIVFRYFQINFVLTVDDLKRRTNATILGIIPKYKTPLEYSQVVVVNSPKSGISEAFRTVRASLQFLPSQNKSKVITTTSTIPGEGKTFVGINLAAIYSMLGRRVIIVDLDLRKPRLAKVFNINPEHGVSTLLTGQSELEDCIYESGVTNLDFIPCGPIPPNPSELIMLPRMQELIDELRLKYDFIFIDTPPIGIS